MHECRGKLRGEGAGRKRERGFPGFPGSLAGCWEKLPQEEPEIGACPEEEEGALG